MNPTFSMEAYAKRVQLPLDEFAGSDWTPQRLQALLRAHLMTIPFENIDVLCEKTPDLLPESIFDKLVLRGRGGYCFEQNALLAQVLDQLGIRYDRLMCRVHFRSALSVPPQSHMALRVYFDDDSYLCDVGFGGSSPDSMLAIPKRGESSQCGNFQLRWIDTQLGPSLLLEAHGEDGASPLYSFRLIGYESIDYKYPNFALANLPDSLFVNNLRVFRKRSEGGAWSWVNEHFGVLNPDLSVTLEPQAWNREGRAPRGSELASVLSTYFSVYLDPTMLTGLERWFAKRQEVLMREAEAS